MAPISSINRPELLIQIPHDLPMPTLASLQSRPDRPSTLSPTTADVTQSPSLYFRSKKVRGA
ncbi:hypothetical protein M408DRAFT_328540 [Serendipita vermifera MAFF 305830]|uniref:Uncharacterized protein n=1 Tax=Serendipita vermifera MAFF 305830 TaxID=933852 RepID=A0A0C3AYS0_SERVB|nr:hypothetical protein M408DRAFT_328540 [Serendipita vermifera MAFF 305830]